VQTKILIDDRRQSLKEVKMLGVPQ